MELQPILFVLKEFVYAQATITDQIRALGFDIQFIKVMYIAFVAVIFTISVVLAVFGWLLSKGGDKETTKWIYIVSLASFVLSILATVFSFIYLV